MRRFALIAFVVAAAASSGGFATPQAADAGTRTVEAKAADLDAVRAAVLDYVEGPYEVAPERIERSGHPNLTKLGRGRDRHGAYRSTPLTYQQLVAAGRHYNQDGHVADDAPKEITVFEVLDQAASVKLTAEWGIDSMHLAKIDRRWLILNVLWQSHLRD